MQVTFVRCVVSVFLATLLACATETSNVDSKEFGSREAVTTEALTSADIGSFFDIDKEEYQDGICWRPSYARGAGTPRSECGRGEERAGALCYPECRAGYDGVGPVCWEVCPAGYADEGPTCRKGWSILVKKSYGRGVGHAPESCAPGLEENAGLCYVPCTADHTGVGPVCWKSQCPATFPVTCGAGCAKDVDVCAKAIADQTIESVEFIGKLIQKDWMGAISAGIEAANTFNLPICKY